jgi:hypothetical protein
MGFPGLPGPQGLPGLPGDKGERGEPAYRDTSNFQAKDDIYKHHLFYWIESPPPISSFHQLGYAQ